MSLKQDSSIISFIEAATEFCELVELPLQNPEEWIELVLPAISSLYACAHQLPKISIEDAIEFEEDDFEVTDKEWKRIYDKIASLFKEKRYYREYFDPSEPIDSEVEPVIGDIADDLSDIYRDIKPGLRAWDKLPESSIPIVIFNWINPNFGSHWGEHALSAMRVLHPINFLRGINSD